MSPDLSSTCSEDLMDQQECQGECDRRTSSMGFGTYGGDTSNVNIAVLYEVLLIQSNTVYLILTVFAAS